MTFGAATVRPHRPRTQADRRRGADLATDDFHATCPRCGDLVAGDRCGGGCTFRGLPYPCKPTSRNASLVRDQRSGSPIKGV